MMRNLRSVSILTSLAVFCCATPVLAMDATAPEAQELMSDYFGNTRICRIDGYFECHGWYYPDGRYVLFYFNSEKMTQDTNDPRQGFNVVRGTWKIEGTKGAYRLCRMQEDQDQQAGPDCGLPEPSRPDLVGEKLELGETYWKYHERGTLKGTTEYYYLLKGHV